VQARNLLCFHAGLCEDIEVVYSSPSNVKSAQATNESSEQSAYIINQTLKVIPNPNNGEFKLVMPENCTIQNLQIIDIHGKEILFETIEDNGDYLKLKMENTATGIYSVKTNCLDGSVFVTRLLIK
ncbi:MAG: T9SS type A sorting domain-containing protein, partial [Crocinitomicaceae bacterium]|nr:T9SS type A sorting domain-containing protein [Crocinitomicaceae bacterium]